MRRTLGFDELIGRRDAVLLKLFLKGALGVLRLTCHVKRHAGNQRPRYECTRCLNAAIEVQRCGNSLIDVLKRGVKASLARARFRGAKYDDLGETELLCHVGQAGARNKGNLDTRQPTFVKIGVSVKGSGRDDGANDGISQELKTLIGVLHRPTLDGGRMRDGGEKQILVLKRVSDYLLRPRELGFLLARKGH